MPRRLFRLAPRSRAQIGSEMREEIESHIALGIDELVARGVTPVEAEAIVRRRYRNLRDQLPLLIASAERRNRKTSRRESVRDVWRDVVFAARQLRRAPTFTLGIALCLAFGIGTSATVFSWMEGLVLRPLPAVRDIDRLISVRPDTRSGFGISLPDFEEWRAQATTTQGLAAVSLSLFNVQPSAMATTSAPAYGMFVSANYFRLLGIGPPRGRYFSDADDQAGAEVVAVISDALWRQQFGSDPDVVGTPVVLNAHAARIIGVAPADFIGTIAGARFDIWVPLSARPILTLVDANLWQRRDYRWLDVIGRLAPNATLEQAHAEFESIGRAQAATYVESRGRRVEATEFDFGTARQLTPLFGALIVITGLVILIICANVANLLLARATARRAELAVRLSLGATRSRVIRQLMTESSLLAALGGVTGTVLAWYAHGLQVHLMPSSTTSSITLATQSGLDLRFLAFVVAVTCGSVLFFGLAPAMIGSRFEVARALRAGSRGIVASGARTRAVLVIAQFALALSALVCTALFLKRDRNVRGMNVGFRDPEHVLLIQTEASSAGYRDLIDWRADVERVSDQLGRLRAVTGVSTASFVPLGFIGYVKRPVEIPGQHTESGVPDRILVNGVSPDYFGVMRIPLLRGRGIDQTDTPDRPAVVVVNDAFVARYLPDVPPLGRVITLAGRALTVVGVAKSAIYDYRSIDEPPPPLAYYAWRQAPSTFVTFHLRTAGDPLSVAREAQVAIRGVSPRLTMLAPVSLADYSSVPFYPSRSALIVISVLAAGALVLASMGLFSVISYGVELRRREIGIRVALGASRARIIGLFARASMFLVAYGVGVGTIAAVLVTAGVRSRVPQLPGGTPVEFALPALVLALSAIIAGLLPARRAAAVDPAATLRTE